MGFNSSGVEVIVERLKRVPKHRRIIIGANIGKNKVTDNKDAESDYLTCLSQLFPYVDYFTVNVSSPNTPNLRELQDREPLTKLLKTLQDFNHSQPTPKPILLKIAPDLGDPQLEEALLRYLDPDDPAFNKIIYRGVALVGFDSDSYAPGTSPLTEADLTAALASATKSWHGSVSHYIAKHKLAEIGIELFCVPFPSVEAFRDAFLEELGIK